MENILSNVWEAAVTLPSEKPEGGHQVSSKCLRDGEVTTFTDPPLILLEKMGISPTLQDSMREQVAKEFQWSNCCELPFVQSILVSLMLGSSWLLHGFSKHYMKLHNHFSLRLQLLRVSTAHVTRGHQDRY